MELSARNQLMGTVIHIKEGAVMAEVTVSLKGGEELVSVITVSSVHRLGIKSGSEVTVIVKATEVMLATGT